MILYIAVCDDDQTTHDAIKSVAATFQIKYDIDLVISHYFNGSELIEAYKTGRCFDVIFMDIEFPNENGIEVIQTIRKYYKRLITTIFLTSYPKYMQDSFSVHAYNFISKPISYNTFEEQILSITEDNFTDETKIMLLDSDNNAYYINVNDILYIKSGQKFSYKNQLVFFTKNQMFHLRVKIEELPEIKKTNLFFSPNRGIFVNMMHINHLEHSDIVLNNGTRLNIAHSKLKEFKAIYNKYLTTRR